MEKYLPLALMVDVDGTLALMSDRSPYDWNRVKEDAVNEPVASMVHLLWKHGFTVIVLTGRDGICLEDTKEWLTENNIPFDYIYSRPKGNFEKDAVIKERIYRQHIEGKFSIFAVFDDRLQVCQMWHKLGLPLYRVGDPESKF